MQDYWYSIICLHDIFTESLNRHLSFTACSPFTEATHWWLPQLRSSCSPQTAQSCVRLTKQIRGYQNIVSHLIAPTCHSPTVTASAFCLSSFSWISVFTSINLFCFFIDILDFRVSNDVYRAISKQAHKTEIHFLEFSVTPPNITEILSCPRSLFRN